MLDRRNCTKGKPKALALESASRNPGASLRFDGDNQGQGTEPEKSPLQEFEKAGGSETAVLFEKKRGGMGKKRPTLGRRLRQFGGGEFGEILEENICAQETWKEMTNGTMAVGTSAVSPLHKIRPQYRSNMGERRSTVDSENVPTPRRASGTIELS